MKKQKIKRLLKIANLHDKKREKIGDKAKKLFYLQNILK